jgi:hypothetical protein
MDPEATYTVLTGDYEVKNGDTVSFYELYDWPCEDDLSTFKVEYLPLKCKEQKGPPLCSLYTEPVILAGNLVVYHGHVFSAQKSIVSKDIVEAYHRNRDAEKLFDKL